MQAINRMLEELAGKAGIQKKHIYEIVLTGNPCMLHLATNLDLDQPAKYPYRSLPRNGHSLRSIDHNLDIAEFGRIYLPPLISDHVGADTTAGLLATKLYDRKGITLFIDLGVQCELVLAVHGKMVATWSSGLPLTEIELLHGPATGGGLIEAFAIADEGRIRYKTAGAAAATGIGPGGLLDIAGELEAHGIIDKHGRFRDPAAVGLTEALRSHLVWRNGKRVFQISERIEVAQKDIHQIQLAKGAIRSGVDRLLAKARLTDAQVCKILLAGRKGGRDFLLNKSHRLAMANLVRKIAVLTEDDYRNRAHPLMKSLGL